MTGDKYDPYDFANRRHIGPTTGEIVEMLEVVGAPTLHTLIDETLPPDIRQSERIDFGRSLSERRVLEKMRETANKNRLLVSLIGQGYHGTTMPPAIQRNIFENPAWYTAYSPYQPEISQGRLEALLNFQTLVCDLTALDVANASLLDEATAAAEAMAMAHRVAAAQRETFFVDQDCRSAGPLSSATPFVISTPPPCSAPSFNIPAFAARSTISPRLSRGSMRPAPSRSSRPTRWRSPS
jgi:glycine dehydrogenase